MNSVPTEDISVGETLVITNEEHRFLALDQLREVEPVSATLLLELAGRNTVPVMTLAALEATPSTKQQGEITLSLDLPNNYGSSNFNVWMLLRKVTN